MENLEFDTGVKTYRVGGGQLRFNPTDPNLYARFLEAQEEITQLEEALKTAGAEPIALLKQADTALRQILGKVFEADMDEILGHVSLLAMGSNGQRLITNLFNALEGILSQGARDCAREEAARL